MSHTPRIALLIALVAFGGVCVSSQDAQAGSLTTAAYQAAVKAHQNAQTFTNRAAATQGLLAGEQSVYLTSAASSSFNVRYAGRQRFIRFLRDLQSKIRVADQAHVTAIQKWAYYNRVSGTSNGSGNITALSASRTRFAATLANLASTIATVGAQR